MINNNNNKKKKDNTHKYDEESTYSRNCCEQNMVNSSKDLFNKYDKKILIDRLNKERFDRITLSFYLFQSFDHYDLKLFRDQLYDDFAKFNVLGRVYLANEGINAQLSVPKDNYQLLCQYIDDNFKNAMVNQAIEHGIAFYKLTIKIKNYIVSAGKAMDNLSVSNQSKNNYLDAYQWNQHISQIKKSPQNKKILVVDIRNSYEHQVGYFDQAFTIHCETFRQQLLLLPNKLKNYKDHHLLLYCTGGIRCEKASVVLYNQGFTHISQLKGGIVSYCHQAKNNKLENLFIGKNFVFDNRMGERINNQVIAKCYTCGAASDHHRNCAWQGCHALFIQCSDCVDKFDGCCSAECQENLHLPEAEKKAKLKNIHQAKRFLNRKDYHCQHYQKSKI